jgi:hypothetical protein
MRQNEHGTHYSDRFKERDGIPAGWSLSYRSCCTAGLRFRTPRIASPSDPSEHSLTTHHSCVSSKDQWLLRLPLSLSFRQSAERQSGVCEGSSSIASLVLTWGKFRAPGILPLAPRLTRAIGCGMHRYCTVTGHAPGKLCLSTIHILVYSCSSFAELSCAGLSHPTP